MKKTSLLIIISTVFMLGCISTETKDGPLSRTLAQAANEKRISGSKVNEIIQEYTAIDVKDPKIGQRYVNDIVKVVGAGGDSTEIDAVRKKYSHKK
jgi:hypothetical protein